MSKLSFKEFLKLSEKEKCERYEELSDHHKFLARISQNSGVEVISQEKLTEAEKEFIKNEMKNVDSEEFKQMEKYTNEMLERAKKKRKDNKE